MATLKDIAKMANVDVSTVSRALNDSGYVHPDTKKRVFEVAKKLSYRPNLMAKALKNGKRQTIGVIVPDLRLSVFANITRTITLTAAERGYATLIAVTNDDPEMEKEALLRMQAGFVDGITIAATDKNTDLLLDINKSGIPVVQTVRRQTKGLPCVAGDYAGCGYDAVNFLYGKGCRNIGFIDGPIDLDPYYGRYIGYQRAIKELHLEEYVYGLEKLNGKLRHYELGYSGTEYLLECNPKLDAIMVAVDHQGMGAIRVLKERGIAVPQQIKILSLTGNSIGDNLETKLSSLEMKSRGMGKKIVDLLLERIETDRRDFENEQILFEYMLSERETT